MNIKSQRCLSPTLRTPVDLPNMPLESQVQNYSAITMARSQLVNGRLVFDNPAGLEQALRQGFFLVKTPTEMDLAPGDLFVRHCFMPQKEGDLSDYSGFKNREVPGAYQGYFDREHDQWENFYIERGNWNLLPESVIALGAQMAKLGIEVLHSILAELDIPRDEWARVTSGLSEGGGHQMLGFNHFRTNKPVRGSKFHRDSGWITVLRSTEPGLIAYIDGRLCSINPEPGHFIINFGSSMEVLAEHLPQKVHANVHGVARTERKNQNERYSYVVFLDSDLAGDIYRYGPAGAQKVQTVLEFAEQEVSRTYNDEILL
ncbi:2OG-Fe(II) oxygenase family protein [Pseudomonas sp. KFB-139]|uniref:2OG-Fe(II) oxygenase family protein n=1 Tax=Pseudomonas serbiensis TaxID=3064350 RepID=A0ABT9CI89_9PSED|nr:2OG-Fe(II) oxygenase family protein [Pseudomonas sp. KFB-138]MDO7925199.1 2OG-Fe(II) oxygenase family protein [Pseudomonas sp. KFB-138]